MRPFRVLVIDDEIPAALYKAGPNFSYTLAQATRERALWVLKAIVEQQKILNTPLELYLAKDLLFEGGSVMPIPPTTAEWQDDFLWSLDVLVLDFKGLSNNAETRLNRRDPVVAMLQLSDEHLSELNRDYPGAAFYLKNRERFAESCQSVLFLTKTDSGVVARTSSMSVIKEFVERWCLGKTEPQTLMFKANAEGFSDVANKINSLFIRVARGYTQLENLDAIDFAATHDEPVLIVGETGTGKEDIAFAIHDRWRQYKQVEAGLDIPAEPTVINCAGLTPELARSELFGHVRGSFTGADDHKIGAILSACGCVGLRSARKLSEKSKLRRQADEYKRLTDLIVGFDKITDDSERYTYLQRYVLPLFNELLVPKDTLDDSAFSFFSNLHYEMTRAMVGSDFVGEFISGLVSRNQNLLEENDGVVSFKNTGPFGTLFLDEFGDLPAEVQTLLLRYLQSKEIQPLGYPDRIRQANVRIIAATSDPRVARFVGEKLYGGWRSQAELEKPLREDLIFRVKGQVVRAMPVTAENVKETLYHFIARSGAADRWEEEAKSYLAGKLISLLSSIKEAIDEGPKAVHALPTFGHRRELVRIVTLANAFVTKARKRGLRPAREKVTEDVIDIIWKPSVVQTHTLPMPASSTSSSALTREANSGDNHETVEALLERIHTVLGQSGEPLPADWTTKLPKQRGEDLRQWVLRREQAEDVDSVASLHGLLVNRPGSNKGFPDDVYRAAFGYDGGTVRPWISKAIKKLRGQ